MNELEKMGVRWLEPLTREILLDAFSENEMNVLLRDSEEYKHETFQSFVYGEKKQLLSVFTNEADIPFLIENVGKFASYWNLDSEPLEGLEGALQFFYLDSQLDYYFNLNEKIFLDKYHGNSEELEGINPGYRMKKIFEPKVEKKMVVKAFNKAADVARFFGNKERTKRMVEIQIEELKMLGAK